MMSSHKASNIFDNDDDDTETRHDQLPSVEEIHHKYYHKKVWPPKRKTSRADLPRRSFAEKNAEDPIYRRTVLVACISLPFIFVAVVIMLLLGIIRLNDAAHPDEHLGVTETVGGPGSSVWKSTTAVPATARSSVRIRMTVPPTATSTKTRMELALEYIEPVSGAAVLEDKKSSQSRALDWIVHVDTGIGSLEVPAGSSEQLLAHRLVQRYVLAVLYYDVLFSPHENSEHSKFAFLHRKNECKWHDTLDYTAAEQVYYYGVACNDEGRVTSIVMPNSGLQGTIPPEIELLTSLRVLNLSGNRLYGTLPPEMSNLLNLEEALFAGNHLTGTIPDYLDTLTRLQQLSLSDNFFNGTLPDLAHLKQLTHLDFSNNLVLTGTIPASWGEMTALRGLSLSSNHLDGVLPAQIGDMTNLRDLRLTGNFLEGTLPDTLKNCMHLKNLYLENNQFSGELDVLGSLPFLEGVLLADNEFEGELDALMEYFDDLMILDASNNRLRGTLPRELFRKDKLKVLDLHGNMLTGVLPNFPDNYSLEYLALHNNAFRNDVPASVSNLRALT
eukprot:CAMPEP_0194314756 /NCGR_PEP_ID=MMETSP0171-20130528/11599_1 /TAXON_ID=218684 /ORGANISM="Corethron pennatum, Strain L29A3" /LENGTH=555 /DNA_ID=CAMNT_0039070311 /DNA_START=102 /DNA_END=1766 /DNA_ORIENTATION=+